MERNARVDWAAVTDVIVGWVTASAVSRLPAAIEEFLRYDGPVNQATLRFTAAPVELGAMSNTMLSGRDASPRG